MLKQYLQKVAGNEKTDMTMTEAFEVADRNHKFMVIEGPQPVVVQFFRDYGHPMYIPHHLLFLMVKCSQCLETFFADRTVISWLQHLKTCGWS